MTYETHIVARRGHMTPQGSPPGYKDGEFVTDEVEVHAGDPRSGLFAHAIAATEEEALRAALAALESTFREWAYIEEGARERAKEDPMVRLARLEALVREAGLDG